MKKIKLTPAQISALWSAANIPSGPIHEARRMGVLEVTGEDAREVWEDLDDLSIFAGAIADDLALQLDHRAAKLARGAATALSNLARIVSDAAEEMRC